MKRSDNKKLLTAAVSICAVFAVIGCVFMYRSVSEQNVPTSVISVVSQKTNDPAVTTTTSSAPVTTVQKRSFSWSTADEQRVTAMLKEYAGQVSFYYEDLDSGYTYLYNAEHSFFAASLMKAPFCMYILQLASQGKCNLAQKVTYTAAFQSAGTGIIKNAAFGTEYTIQQLIEYTIRYSDNAALRMLRSVFSVDGFKSFAASIGITDTASIGLITNSKITAKDAAVYMHAIYDFIKKDTTYGAMLYEYMTHTRNPMFYSTYPLIRKYGWADASFHDMAIVDAPHPYILILFTDHEDGTAGDFAMFRNVANNVEKLSGQPDER